MNAMQPNARTTRSISFRLNALFVLLVTGVLALSGTYTYLQTLRELQRTDEQDRLSLQARLSINLQAPVWNLDGNVIAQILGAELKAPVRGILVADLNGRQIALTGVTPVTDAGAVFDFPLVYAQNGVNEVIGHVTVGWSEEVMQNALSRQVRQRLFEILLLDLVLVSALWLSLRVLIFKRLDALRRALEQAAEQRDAAQEITLRDDLDDEFGKVVDGFNRIARRLADDVDARRQAEQEIRSAYDQLRNAQTTLIQSEKLAALGALVAGVAHELNTPIGNAVTIASTLRDKSREFGREIETGAVRRSALNDYTDTIERGSELVMRNLDQAADLIADFKQVAVDQTSAQRRRFDLGQVIEEVLSTLHHLVRNKPFQVVTALEQGIEMDSYPGPLGQVINNLFNNALLHGFAGRDHGEIHITARRDGTGRATLEIRDNGNGIPAENLGRVFDPFFTTRLGQGGSGLGLNIVHNIVTRLLGGGVDVVSTPAGGTIFVLTLPLTAPPEDSAPRTGHDPNNIGV